MDRTRNRGGPSLRPLFVFAVTAALFAVCATPAIAATASKRIALTFENGPQAGQTEQIVKILQDNGVKATFFMVGKNARSASASARVVSQAGMPIGNHTETHQSLSRLSKTKVRTELKNAQTSISGVTGITPAWFRAPTGESNSTIDAVVAELGLRKVKWDLDSNDSQGLSATSLTKRVVTNAGSDKVVRFHDGGGTRTNTIKALPSIIGQLKAKGYTFVTLDELYSPVTQPPPTPAPTTTPDPTPDPTTTPPTPTTTPDPTTTPTPTKKIALTFDDGPWGNQTLQIVSILKQHDAKATFFMIGEQVGWDNATARAVADAGMDIGNHTQTHPYLPQLTTTGIRSQFTLSQQAVFSATGKTPTWFRPPYGETDANVDSIAASMGLRKVMWDIDPEDWASPSASTIVSRVVSRAGADKVVLMHDGGNNLPNTVTALPGILTQLKAQGYTFVTLDELPRVPLGFPGDE